MIPTEIPAKISLSTLIALAKEQGFLTYQQANDYLPDEVADASKVNTLLELVEGMGIDFVEGKATSEVPVEAADSKEDDDREKLFADELPKLTDDPIRMYLSQMCRIPLLTRGRRNYAG